MDIRRLLIANRGEIAVRVIRACRELDIEPVTVFEPDDRDALHVELADEAHEVASYLDQAALLAAAAACDAVHPGYGYLAENPGFATGVERAGLVWVGPPPTAMRALGDKVEARRLAEAAGVPVVPGYAGVDLDDATLIGEATRLGAPLLVKAAAGGGGRGMRIVTDLDDLPEALAAARREAAAAFDDDRVFLERRLAAARHVEVQILCDAHRGAVHLGERDCSLQRRHQKIIEESPSPAVSSQQELDRAGSHVPGCGRDREGGRAQFGAQLGVHGWRGRLLDDLLVAALQRAVAFAEVDGAAMGVTEDLHLDVTGGRQPPLQEHPVVVECGRRLATGRRQSFRQVVEIGDDPHAAAAPAGGGLDQQRCAQPRCLPDQGGVVQVDTGIAGHDRHTRRLGQPASLHLVTQRAHRRRRRAHPDQPCPLDAGRKAGVLSQVAVAGVDGVAGRGGRQQCRLIEIARHLVGLVGKLDVQGVSVVRLEHRRARCRLAAGADHPHRDLAAVGDQESPDVHAGSRFSRKWSGRLALWRRADGRDPLGQVGQRQRHGRVTYQPLALRDRRRTAASDLGSAEATAASSWSAVTTWCTRPKSSASAAPNRRPLTNSSRARRGPTARST